MKYLPAESRKSKGGTVCVLMRPDWSTFDPKEAVEQIRILTKELRTFVHVVVEEKPSFARLVEAYEDIEDRIAQVDGPLENLYSSMRTPLVEEAYREVKKLLRLCYRDIWSNQKFYRAHRAFRHMRMYRKLGKEEKSAFGIQLDTFKQYGVSLTPKGQLRLRKLEEEIEELEQRFEKNLAHSLHYKVSLITDESALAGVPKSTKAMMRDAAIREGSEGWAVFAKDAMRVPIMEFADDRSLRESVYKAYATAASDIGRGGVELDNCGVAERLLTLRYRVARLLGKGNHAELTIEDLMAESPRRVMRFLHSVRPKIFQSAKEELRKLKKFSKSELGHTLEPWDVEYAKNRLLKKQFGFTSSDLEPHLTFRRVLRTLFALAEKMYGVKIRERSDPKGWLPHVRFFEVYEHTGDLLGGFYLDPYARMGETVKSESLWTQCVLTRRKIGRNEIRLPLTIIHLNMADSGEGDEQCFSHKDLIGLFHEFGHTLQELLIKSEYLATSPENIEWDVIEIPSTLMENWAWDIETLAEVTRGKRANSAPWKLLLAIHRQRPIVDSYGRWSLLEYLERSLIDIALHSTKPRAGFVRRVVRRVRAEVGILPSFADDRFPNNFPYIFGDGYDASFYSYLWSWRFAAAIRQEHLKTGHSVDSFVSRRFRKEFMEESRIRVAKANLTAFFRRKLPSAKALLEQSRLL
ncbi:MAG: M3 family metallopeptidase [bacterium]|nr:M3 family metallopeptidase [bacterium]